VVLIWPGLTEPPHTWTIISPEQSTSGHTEILVSTGTTVITLDALDRIDQVRHNFTPGREVKFGNTRTDYDSASPEVHSPKSSSRPMAVS
jgi:hypothetical protein